MEEAQKKLETMSEDEYMRRIADLREKAILDEKARFSYAIDQGIEQGKKEKNLEIAKNVARRNFNRNDYENYRSKKEEILN